MIEDIFFSENSAAAKPINLAPGKELNELMAVVQPTAIGERKRLFQIRRWA
jgi:hypothetical protein